jgi:cell division protein FtsW
MPGFSFQPAEFMKPCFIVFCAWMFSEKLKNNKFPGFLIASALYSLIVVLLVAQPDIGSTVIFTLVWMGMYFLSGMPVIVLMILGVVAIIGGIAAYAFLPHVTARIDKFLSSDSESNYQVVRSLEAFSKGGFFGRGPGEGVVKSHIPDSHTDFIFAVLGEEMGLIAVLFVIGIFAFIVLRGFKKVYQQNDLFVTLAVAGILMNFGLQAIINMGVTLKLLPTKGMTMPFISYGGSSILAQAISIGILLALTRKRYASK